MCRRACMLINFTREYQVNSRAYMEQEIVQQVNETRLLGVILRDDLSFKCNTESITKNAYKRMTILHKLGKFSLPIEDLLNIYILYIRSVLKQSAVVCRVESAKMCIESNCEGKLHIL